MSGSLHLLPPQVNVTPCAPCNNKKKREKLPCLKLLRQVETPVDMKGVDCSEKNHTHIHTHNQQYKTNQMLMQMCLCSGLKQTS